MALSTAQQPQLSINRPSAATALPSLCPRLAAPCSSTWLDGAACRLCARRAPLRSHGRARRGSRSAAENAAAWVDVEWASGGGHVIAKRPSANVQLHSIYGEHSSMSSTVAILQFASPRTVVGLGLILVFTACNMRITMASESPSVASEDELVVPDVEWPSGLAFSAWESHAHRALLTANGFSIDRKGRHAASLSEEVAIRQAAFQLLSASPEPVDEPRLRAGLQDVDALVQCWAAFGLSQLGEAPKAREVLVRLSKKKPEWGSYAPLVAAESRARLSDPGAFPHLLVAMSDFEETVEVVRRIFPFAALQGQNTGGGGGGGVDVWPLYNQGLRSSDDDAQGAVLAQLSELADSAAVPLLTDYLQRDPSAYRRSQAEALLQTLSP